MEKQPLPPVRPTVSTNLSGSPHPGAPSTAGTPGRTSSAATAAAVLSISTASAAALGNQSGGNVGDSTGASAGGGFGGHGAAGRPPLGPAAAPLLSQGAAGTARALVLLLIFLLSSLGNCAVIGVIDLISVSLSDLTSYHFPSHAPFSSHTDLHVSLAYQVCSYLKALY